MMEPDGQSPTTTDEPGSPTPSEGTGSPPQSMKLTDEEYQAAARGTILEAAFVDPAYSWPPRDGEGKNAIELQASVNLTSFDDDRSDVTTDSEKERMKLPSKPKRPEGVSKWGFFNCCRNDDAVVKAYTKDVKAYEKKKVAALKARKEYAQNRRARAKNKAKQYRKDNKYNLVPEGILVYRLDTSTHTIKLMSAPHSNTDLEALMTEMKVIRAVPSADKSRRGMELVGEDGTLVTLVACEQRTATAWLEAMNLMKAKRDPGTSARDVSRVCRALSSLLLSR